MFLNNYHVEQNDAVWCAQMLLNSIDAGELQNDADDYQNLLNTVDAARAGLASDEHDYDCNTEEDII